MIDIMEVYFYKICEPGVIYGPKHGKLVCSQEAWFEALFVPDGKGFDSFEALTVSGREGVSHNRCVWFKHKVIDEEVRTAIFKEMQGKYEDAEREAEFRKSDFLRYGSTENEEGA